MPGRLRASRAALRVRSASYLSSIWWNSRSIPLPRFRQRVHDGRSRIWSCACRRRTRPIPRRNSAPWILNWSCARSQGSRSSGGGARDGATSSPASCTAARSWILRAWSYSGCRDRHDACVFSLRAAWHSGSEQVRCRSPIRTSGWNQRRHSRQGRFLAAMAAIVSREPGRFLFAPLRYAGFTPGLAGSLLPSAGGSLLASAEGAAGDPWAVQSTSSPSATARP